MFSVKTSVPPPQVSLMSLGRLTGTHSSEPLLTPPLELGGRRSTSVPSLVLTSLGGLEVAPGNGRGIWAGATERDGMSCRISMLVSVSGTDWSPILDVFVQTPSHFPAKCLTSPLNTPAVIEGELGSDVSS